jgi:hypothetical protein
LFIIIEIVPESLSKRWIQMNQHSIDIALLMFTDPRDELAPNSCSVACTCELLLLDSIPRLYVQSKADKYYSSLNSVTTTTTNSASVSKSQVDTDIQTMSCHDDLLVYLNKEDLPSPIYVSSIHKEGVAEVLNELLQLSVHPEKGIPKSKRRTLLSNSTFQISVVIALTVVAAMVFMRSQRGSGGGGESKKAVPTAVSAVVKEQPSSSTTNGSDDGGRSVSFLTAMSAVFSSRKKSN